MRKNPTRQQWQELLGDAKHQELVRLLMGIRRSLAEGNKASADMKVAQALRLVGEQ